MPAGIPSLILRSWNEFDLKFERAPFARETRTRTRRSRTGCRGPGRTARARPARACGRAQRRGGAGWLPGTQKGPESIMDRAARTSGLVRIEWIWPLMIADDRLN
jgi:hypothetical protein